MDQEKLSLSWKEFDFWTKKTFKEQREDTSYADVTLAAGDNHLKAHKFVLSSCSPFFKKVFQSTNHQMPFIYLKGISPEHLEAILNFIYTGEAEISSSEVEQFLQAAEILEIQGLVKTEYNAESPTQGQPSNTANHLPEKKPFANTTWWDANKSSNALVIDEFKSDEDFKY